MRTGPSSPPLMTTPIPEGPGFPRHPPSTYATSSDITGFGGYFGRELLSPLLIDDAPICFCRQDDYLIPFHSFAVYSSVVRSYVQNLTELQSCVHNFFLHSHLQFALCTASTICIAPIVCVDVFYFSVKVVCVDGRKGWHNNTEPVQSRLSD